jgi:aspartyl-tRNA synthetase
VGAVGQQNHAARAGLWGRRSGGGRARGGARPIRGAAVSCHCPPTALQEAAATAAAASDPVGLAQGRYRGDGPLPGGHEAVQASLQRLGARAGDTLFVAHVPSSPAAVVDASQLLAGRARLKVADWLVRHGELTLPDQPHMLWVTDFPLFEIVPPDVGGSHMDASIPPTGATQWTATHHPFTAPIAEDAEKLRVGADFSGITGQHYDLVCNGVELGGGSVRIHDASMQRFVLRDVLGMSDTGMQRSFGQLLDSLDAGCPPHAGFALGVDRLVSLAVGAHSAASIRDVIAFPKSHTGAELMSGAPTHIEASALQELGLQAAMGPSSREDDL